MSIMTKDEAYNVLGLVAGVPSTDIETRYATLIKRYKSEQNLEKLEEIALAYNILTDRYIAPVEDEPYMKKVIFGKTRKEWGNIWHYNKLKYFVIVVVSVFVISIIWTMVTNKPADFKLAFVGNYYISDSDKTAAAVQKIFPEYENVEINSAIIGKDIPGDMQMAGTQKAMIIMSVSGEDVIITDKDLFDRYARMGAFVPLDDSFDKFSDIAEKSGMKISKVEASLEPDDSSGETVLEKHVYGVEILDKKYFENFNVVGESFILTISVKSEHKDRAMAFIEAVCGKK